MAENQPESIAPLTHPPFSGPIPELSVEGSVDDAGEMLGAGWREALKLEAASRDDARTPWWRHPDYAPAVERLAPHLPDLYRAMARGAGIDEYRAATRIPESSGCTSFAVAPKATSQKTPISGQTKDVSRLRGMQLQVLRMKLDDSPHSALTLTYQGWLFGHGFVTGGCSLYRNSLFVGPAEGRTPYAVWGMLALHCPDVEELMRLTYDYPPSISFHVTAADESGGIVGIEHGPGGPVFLQAENGIYTHANSVVSDSPLRASERDQGFFRRADSELRVQTLFQRLSADQGRLTAPLCFAALGDHTGYPTSICRHQSEDAMTAAAVVAEPTRRLLHVSRGPVCQHWPRTHAL